jgi:hypothetical protein
MSKRFFYVSLGVLTLAIAWSLGAMSARADWDNEGVGPIAGSGSWSPYYWGRSGQCYYLSTSGSWTSAPEYALPVSAGDLAVTGNAYGGGVLAVIVTRAGQTWLLSSSTGLWEQGDLFPGSVTATEKTSWGGIKKQFKK